MKAVVRLALAATLAASVAAQPHGHQHAHLHKKHAHDASPIEKREPDVVTEYAVGPTVTLYRVDGEEISPEEAKEGIKDGLFVVVGKTTPKFTPPPEPESTSSAVPESSAVVKAAQFYEEKESSTSSSSTPPPEPSTTSTSTSSPPPSPPPSTTSSSEAAPTPTAEEEEASDDYDDGSSGGAGIDAPFRSGKVKCSTFPSAYGAVPITHLDTGGWTGIQRVPNYKPSDASIGLIETAVIGEGGCTPNSFCSYACPVGYEKTQWPAAQGSDNESIGGLYCNSEGNLELTRTKYNTLCRPGVGGVYVQNDLDEVVSTCRTDYPGTESMVIPTICQGGQKLPLTNPASADSYVWNNKPTTAQYYVNKKGYGINDACVWKNPNDPEGSGNWAPINVGTGMAADGNTYISIFRNLPTSHDVLDFNIEIVGDVNSKCALINNKFTSGSDNGCTTALTGTQGEAIIRFYQ